MKKSLTDMDRKFTFMKKVNLGKYVNENLVLLIYSCFVFSQNIPFDVGVATYDAFVSGIPAGRGELKEWFRYNI